MTGVLHVAGVHVTINQRIRQRCAWCGAVLIDVEVSRGQALSGDPIEFPPTWPVGGLVLIDGNMAALVPFGDGEALPDGACGKLDPEVTR